MQKLVKQSMDDLNQYERREFTRFHFLILSYLKRYPLKITLFL
jgi:hypothetical protein